MEHNISCMSFNLLSRNTGGTTFAEAPVRFPYAVKTIFKYNPDILGVQEAEAWVKTAQLDWYLEMTKVLTTLGNYDYCAIIDDKDCKLERQTIGAGLIIFFKKNRFTLLDRGCVRYEEGPDRYFQWVKLHDNDYDKDLFVTNTHFSINPWNADRTARDVEKGKELRRIEGVHLCDFWKENVSEGTALFATGDYNHVAAEPAYAELHNGPFVFSREIAAEPDPHTRNTVDYIYVNPAATDILHYLTILDTFEKDSPIVNGDPILYRSSDHWPTICYANYK
ncbi:MAG: hypothetical protein IJN42_07990 [Clostridia bacterium]|nr:hypothetical protein [Clostridia bacterium]